MPQIRTKKFFFVKNIDNSGFLLTLYVMCCILYLCLSGLLLLENYTSLNSRQNISALKEAKFLNS